MDLTVILYMQKLIHEFQKCNSVFHPLELKSEFTSVVTTKTWDRGEVEDA